MKELLQLGWDALLFKHEAYVQHVARADALKRGLALLVLVTLVAGVISLVVDVVGDLRPVDVEAELREAEEGLQSFLEDVEPFFDLPPEVKKGIYQGFRAMRPGIEIGTRIDELPTRLPRPVGKLLSNLGAFLSLPFSRLAGWIGYGIWVLLVAKLLGGRATVSQMLGTTALYAVPHVLDILGPVPCLGGMLGLVATVWGIAIYVKALAVANDFGVGRAIVATVLPALIIALLALLGLMGLVLFAVASESGQSLLGSGRFLVV
jgi:hypothetical protein